MSTEMPRLKAPAGACDCHMHIYDADTPVVPTAVAKTPVWVPTDADRHRALVDNPADVYDFK